MQEVTAPTRRIARFGPFTLDLQLGELRRDGAVVPLRPKPLEVLVRLVGNAGSLTPREELLESVWGDVHLASDTVLHTAIGEIRQALEDDASAPVFVETVHRRGYRFVSDVSWGEEAASAEPDGAPRQATRRRRWAAGAAVVITALALTWLAFPDSTAGPTPVADEASEELLRARYLVNHGTRADIRSGVDFLRGAVARPGAGLLAWSGLAVGELRLGNLDAAGRAAERALEIDPRSAEAMRVLGQTLMDERPEEAERLLLTALEIDPATGKAHYAYSVFLALTARMDEAVRMAETAAALAPRTMSVQLNLARLLYYNGDLAGAARASRNVLDLDEGGAFEAAETLQAALWLAGDIAGARDAAVRSASEMGATSEQVGRFAAADPETGLREALAWRLQELRRRPAARPESHIEAACLCVQLEDYECAFEELAQLPPVRELTLPTRLRDPRLTPLRSRKEFTALEGLWPHSGA